MIPGKSETVQITVRDTKNCFYIFEDPPSRMAKQVAGPRIRGSWLEHLDDESLGCDRHCRNRELGFARSPKNMSSPDETTARTG